MQESASETAFLTEFFLLSIFYGIQHELFFVVLVYTQKMAF